MQSLTMVDTHKAMRRSFVMTVVEWHTNEREQVCEHDLP